MSLSIQIMDEIKVAMRAKDTVALEALRAVKSELLLAQTASGSKEEISAEDEIKLLQRLVKTRKESARIFTEQNRLDLAEPELAQIAVIEKFLPAQLSEAEVEAVIAKIIAETGASGIACRIPAACCCALGQNPTSEPWKNCTVDDRPTALLPAVPTL